MANRGELSDGTINNPCALKSLNRRTYFNSEMSIYEFVGSKLWYGSVGQALLKKIPKRGEDKEDSHLVDSKIFFK